MSSTGIPEFFQGLAAHLVAQVNEQAIVATFQVGDGVEYHGSKVADHGYYRVVSVSPAGGSVSISRPDSSRTLVVRAASLLHVADAPVPPLPRFEVGDVVEYRGSLVDYHGYWLVRGIEPGTGMVDLRHSGSGAARVARNLRCRPWSVKLADEEIQDAVRVTS